MPFRAALIAAAMATVAWSASVARAGQGGATGLYINAPNLEELGDMFAHPDTWRDARSHLKGLVLADHMFGHVPDAEVGQWLAELKSWNLALELEVGAVKEWSATGRNTFAIEAPQWRRIIRLGSGFSSIAMDEPLVSARDSLHKPDAYAIEETAQFVAAVRAEFPDLLIGDIEAYPSIAFADHLRWIAGLRARLAELGVRGIDFYRLDVDWIAFTAAHVGSWAEVKRLEEACHNQGLPFSLIYWASDYPAKKAAGTARDADWYDGVMAEGRAYAAVGGRPDQPVIESWVGAPSHAVPDSAPWTFTRSVRDFAIAFPRETGRK